jgi:O-antigen ligase
MNDLLLSSSLFAPAVALVVVLALTAPLPALLMLDLLLVFLPGNWLISGVRVDPGDLVIGGILLGLALRGWRGSGRPWYRLPGIGLWLLLGVALSAAYLVAPENQPNLTGPVRIAYQLYRYCWKPILYFPLAALLLGGLRRTWAVLWALLLSGDVCAVLALPEGFRGLRAQGPFDSPNTMGALLIVPMLIAVAGLLSDQRGLAKLVHGASLLLLGRALLFTGSRGALMAVCLGAVVLLWQAARRSAGRRRLARLAPLALAGLLAAAAMHPGLLSGPNLQRFLTLAHPMSEDTFQWRLKERWPHFWRQVEAHPWFGVGTYVDPSLGTSANTPHNGYISIAVMSGLPALVLYVLLGGLALYRTLLRLRRERRLRRAAGAAGAATSTAWRPPGGPARPQAVPAGAAAAPANAAGAEAGWLLDALVAAALAGLLVHNFDDTVIVLPALAKQFWLLVGLGLVPPGLAALQAARPARAAGAARLGRPLPAAGMAVDLGAARR